MTQPWMNGKKMENKKRKRNPSEEISSPTSTVDSAGDQLDLEAGPHAHAGRPTTTIDTNESIPSPSNPSNVLETNVNIGGATGQKAKDFGWCQALFSLLYVVTLCAPVAEFHVPLLGDITVAFCLSVIHIMSFLLITWSISELRGDVAELKGDVAELKG
eukprot:CAMPEP_0178543084 /NCGR_PEP_ID=MMETSP0697-20121206/2393_1 /TAXON_ID=265572 /ORGANISM="Extubocellulus spinifer, Strain CCMP396" /LENGTH=158 /DNA_ID=CAMNT_0020175507 /DNA_START=645 /DNA_END=1118 /DNA_ORIENTATION=-